jgi:flavodoxin I
LKETGIFYGSSSGKTESVARRIHEKLGDVNTGIRNIADSSSVDLLDYRSLIFGIPTWGIGELQEDWVDFLQRTHQLELTGKKIALFGLGDQESYPDTFADSLGILYESLLPTGCDIIGRCAVSGFEFIKSAAIREGMFVGLVLDEENQSHLTESRINDWLDEIRPIIQQT